MNSRQTFLFNHFKTIITTYNGDIPFHHFFNKYCKINASLGSKDRRILREIIYSVYRTGPSWKNKPAEELFIIPNTKNADDLLKGFYQDLELNENEEAFEYPFTDFLCQEFKNEAYYRSFLNQPLVWIRVNQKNYPKFKAQYSADIKAEYVINETFTAIGFKNSTGMLSESFPVEIQDLASQMASSEILLNDGLRAWDCCCGAGGKSLFVAEIFKRAKLYVSDIRPAILENMKMRFKKNRLMIPKKAIVDLVKKPEKINFEGEIAGRDFFDVIIADVPCSGSGTWAREPENFTYFNLNKMNEMVGRQINIVKNSLRFLKQGGKLYYITCSVFEMENNGVIKELESSGSVKVISAKMINGYDKGADNMFIAELTKK